MCPSRRGADPRDGDDEDQRQEREPRHAGHPPLRSRDDDAAVRPWRRSLTGARDPSTLSIVVPAFDEERRIGSLLDVVARTGDEFAERAGCSLVEIVVVDDGSRDRTPEIVRGFRGLDSRLRLIQQARNRGKGAAVRAGMLAATGELALFTDVDLSAPLSDLVPLADAVAGGADLALGSRALPESILLARQPAYRELLGKGFNLALRRLTALPYRDTQCGFKLFRLRTTRPLFELQSVDGFAFDAELCVLARARGLRIAEVPVHWRNDPRTHVTFARSMRMAAELVRIARLARRAGDRVAAAPAHIDRVA
jgi:dolichyl-phosphate beta-glucosyltransferase